MHLAEKRHQYLRYIGTIKQGLSLIVVDDALVPTNSLAAHLPYNKS